MIKLQPITSDMIPQLAQWAEDTKYKAYFRRCSPTMDWVNPMAMFATSYMITKGTNCIGTVILTNDDVFSKSIEYGALLIPEARDYAKEMQDLLCDYVFHTLKYNRLGCKILATREGLSKRLQEYGFTFEGTLRQSAYLDGGYQDEYSLSLLRSTYLGGK